MATHSSILTWRIPWSEEPGRLIVHSVTKSQTWLKWLSIHARKNWAWRLWQPPTTYHSLSPTSAFHQSHSISAYPSTSMPVWSRHHLYILSQEQSQDSFTNLLALDPIDDGIHHGWEEQIEIGKKDVHVWSSLVSYPVHDWEDDGRCVEG